VFVSETETFQTLSRYVRRKRLPNNKYKRVAIDMRKDPTWPPIGDVTCAENVTCRETRVAS